MSNKFIIEVIHSADWYAAKNQNDEYIVVETMGYPFDMGDCILVRDDLTIYNETKDEYTLSVVQMDSDKSGAITFLQNL